MARIIAGRQFRRGHRRPFVQECRQFGDEFNRTLAGIHCNVGMQIGFRHLSFDLLPARLTGNHQC